MSSQFYTIEEYRKQNDTDETLKKYSDDRIAEILYQTEISKEVPDLTLEQYKSQVLPQTPTTASRTPTRSNVDSSTIEQEVERINPQAAKRKKREREIAENFKRTFAGAGNIAVQNLLDIGNIILQGTPGIAGQYRRINQDKFKVSQQKAMIQAAEEIFGEDSVEIVNRGGVPSLGFKDPTYKYGREAKQMLALIPSVIIPGGLAAKAVGKVLPKTISKGKQTFIKGTVAGAAGEQIGWDIYEDRLANLLGDYVAEDDSAFSDIVRYMEADEDDSQLEARVGVLVEGMLLAGGLTAGWIGAKKLTQESFDKALKPAGKAVMKKLKSLKSNKKIKEGEKEFNEFINNLLSTTQYGKVVSPNVPFEQVSKQKDMPSFGLGKSPKETLKEDENLDQLWQFMPKTFRKNLYDKIGGPFFQSRGDFTPRLFAVWRSSQDAANAWTAKTMRQVDRLEANINKVAKTMSDKKGIGQKEYVQDTFLKIQSYLDGEPIKLTGFRRPKKITLNTKTNRQYDIPLEIRDNLTEIRNLQDSLSELLAQSDLVSKETKQIITSNLGTYLRRSYDAFQTVGFRATTESVEGAKKYFINEYRKQIKTIDGKRYFVQRKPSKKPGRKSEELKYLIKKDGTIITPKRQYDLKLEEFFDQKAEGAISKILNSTKEAKNVLDYTDRISGVLPSTVKKRKNLDPALRALLGEAKDPKANIVTSISKVADFIEKDQFIKNALELGEGKYFFNSPEVSPMGAFNTVIEAPNLGDLTGMYTTEGMASIFNQKRFYSTVGEGDMIGRFLALKGYGQASKTVFNHITHLRNTLGGMIFMLANGRNPLDKTTLKSLNILRNELDVLGKRKKGSIDFDSAYDDLYEEFRSLGIVNTNVKAGEFKQLIQDGAKFNNLEEMAANRISNLSGKKIGSFDVGENLAKGIKPIAQVAKSIEKIGTTAQKLYVAEDDLFKIASYLKELETLKKAYAGDTFEGTVTAYRKTPMQMKQEAAQIVRNTIPNYDLVPQGIKQLRKLPLGNYFSFPAEMYRTSFHIVRQAGKELASTNSTIQLRGAQRMSGFLGVGMLGAEGVNQATKMMYGVTDTIEDAIRNLIEPEYSKNTKQAFVRDEDGNLYKNNFSYIDPYDVIKQPLRTVALAFADGDRTQEERDVILKKAMLKATDDFFTPFYGEALLTKSIVDVTFRDGETDRGKIEGWRTDDQEGVFIDNGKLAFKHVLKTFMPGAVPQLSKLFQSVRDPKLASGQELDFKTEFFANITGIRWSKIDEQYIKKSLERKLGEYSRNSKDIKSEGYVSMKGAERNMLSYQTRKDEKDVINSYLDLNYLHYKNFQNLKLAQESAIDLHRDLLEQGSGKLPVNDIFQKGIKRGSITRKDYRNLNHNKFVPLKISDSVWERIKDENRFNYMSYHDLKAIINSYERGLSSLPMIDLEESEFHREAKELADKRANELFEEKEITERQPKFKGGAISEKHHVPNVNLVPSERVDKNTGQPYESEMERLGFADGGGEIRQRYALGDRIKKALQRRGEIQVQNAEYIKKPREELLVDAKHAIADILLGADKRDIEDLDQRTIDALINNVDKIENEKERTEALKDIARYEDGTPIANLSSPIFNALRHAKLSYEYGDKLLARPALIAKERAQSRGIAYKGAFKAELTEAESRAEKIDALNNVASFSIKDEYPDLDEEGFNQEFLNRFNKSSITPREDLQPGVDFYLRESDAVGVAMPSIFGN
jgi:hypothetical protein